jgi:hypothetical protein
MKKKKKLPGKIKDWKIVGDLYGLRSIAHEKEHCNELGK